MPIIQFDVLMPDEFAPTLHASFSSAVDILVRKAKLRSGHVEHRPHPQIDDYTLSQLTATYEHDRHICPEEDKAHVHRFKVHAEGASSYNSLAMGLSRILTPKAELPRDPAALEQQDQFEQPAIYPWSVAILR